MTLIQSFILGIVEGLSEFLPISSTGHLILATKILHIASTDFVKSFEISIQLGAILAVVFLYWEKLKNINLLKKLILAFLPTGVAGFLLFKHVKALLGNPLIVGVSLFVGGAIILLVEYWYGRQKEDGAVLATHELGYKEAVILGCAQILSMIPGVSRSGSIIVTGMLLRLPRELVTEFTFLLAIPTMLVATAYTLYKDHAAIFVGGSLLPLAIGFVTSLVVALVVVKYFIAYIRKHSFTVFGVYRIIVGIIAILIFI